MIKPELNFIEMGNGEKTLIFLHFFGGSLNTWLPVMEQLKNVFKCIAIDLRGFGLSPKTEKSLSVNENAKDVIELIQQLNINNFVLIGHSMGGKIALAIAAEKLAGLTSLILVAPSPPTPEPISPEKTKEMLETFGNRKKIEELINNITAKKLPNNLFEQTIQDHLHISKIAWDGWILNGSQENISQKMAAIKIPIQVISGQFDTNFTTAFLQEEFKKYNFDIYFEEIKNTGHLIPIEVPSALSDSINYFISSKNN